MSKINTEQIFDKGTLIMANTLNISKDKITPQSEFKKDLELDSLDLVELIMELEDEFNITIEDESASKFKTVNDALSYIEIIINKR